MKKIRRMMALVIAMVMVVAMGTVVFANDGSGDTPSAAANPFATTSTVAVTVNGVMSGDTLHLYKLATPTLDSSNQMVLTWTDAAIETALKDLSSEEGYSPTAEVQAAVAKLVADGKIDVSGDGSPKATAEGTSVTVDAEPGYYLALVKNGAGSLEAKVIYQNMIINALPVPDESTGQYKSHDAITVEVKKSTETIDKKQKQNATAADYTATTADGYKVGDYIPFQITTNIPSYPTNSKVAVFEISDNPTGLKIVKNETYPVTVTVGGTAVEPGETTYSVEVTDGNLSIVFVKSYILANPNAAVVVTYSAELLGNDSNIEVDTTNNTAKIKYNNNPDETEFNEPETEIDQKTYNFTLLKHEDGDETKKLKGAKFTLWDAATDGNKISVIKDGDVYRPIKDGETAVDYIEVNDEGQATVVGLANTTYYLQEDVAPAGYTKLNGRQAAAASETTSTVGVDHKIPNTPGSELPETGGIGTTIFYIIGAILILGAGILLVTRRRMNTQ